MRKVFQSHLRPLGGKVYCVRECRISGVRYRRGKRCLLHYTLRLEEPATGREQDQWVTGTILAGGKVRQRWEKLRRTEPARDVIETEIPGAASPAFAPSLSYLPNPEMLVQVFPYDYRLETLPLLMAGPTPELEPPLLAGFGEGEWRTEAWDTEPVQYQPEWKATLRLTVRARDATSGRSEERRFYAQVYNSEESAEHTYRVLQALWDKTAVAGDTDFTGPRPIAYLSGLRAVLQEEFPGTTLLDILLYQEEEAIPVIRRAARALASLHLGHVDTPRRHSLQDEVADLERGGEFLRSACPQLAPDIENVVDATVAGLEALEEVPPAPTHLDFAFDHIMVKGDRLALIDLDSLAEADPVMDVAIVLAHLSTHSLISALPRDRALEAGRVFVEEYFARVPESWYARLPLLYASAVTQSAAGIIRTHQANWPEKIELLLDEAKDSLAGKIW
jgi:aminoglycoside phosphotransferase (APT) family kinase protein